MTQKEPPSAIVLHSCLSDAYGGFKYFRKRLKLTAWSYVNFASTGRWMSHWNSSPFLMLLARSTPCVLQKVYRPYLTNRLRCSDRVDVLVGHYAFIIKKALGPIVLRAAESPVLLGELSGKSNDVYQLHLAAVDVLESEGELILRLSKGGILLYSVAFTFITHLEVTSVMIGCLQGPRGADALDRVRKATRDLFGLRPKNLLVRLVHQIAHKFDCQDLILVSNENRVLSRQTRKGLVFADYDATWEEIGAVRGQDGDFRLSCKTMPAPDIDAIPSKKRSEAKKRFALVDHAVGLIWAALRRPQFSLAPGATAAANQIGKFVEEDFTWPTADREPHISESVTVMIS
jgi:hypothetical protein